MGLYPLAVRVEPRNFYFDGTSWVETSRAAADI